jgi:P-type Ca2+ transporter type 2C
MLKEKGLNSKEAKKKLDQYGLNEIKDTSKTTSLKILLRQIKSNFIIYLLVVTTIISFFVGKHITAYTIIVIILVIIIVGFVQEYRSEQAINALKNMLVPVSVVIRDGKEKEILSSEIVPGDIIILRTGEKVPADCILLEEKELLVNESILTGEAKEVKKTVTTKKDYEENNLVFMGSYILNGRCVAKVLHTGMNTKFGKIAGLISNAEKELPLQLKVNNIVKYMVIIGIIVSLLTGILVLLGNSTINEELIINTLILVIALAVSSFPESFPVVLITTLAVGSYHMAQKNAIVNRMSIIETLGETTVICSDKTGTITKGEMTVKKVYVDNKKYDLSGTGYNGKGNFSINNKQVDPLKEPVLKRLIYNSILCNDSTVERSGKSMEFTTLGSPTESALLIMGVKAGLFKDDLKFERIEEVPFSSERKIMSVLCKHKQENVVYSKGALEFLIKKCKYVQKGNKIVKLTSEEKNKIKKINKEMTSTSLRTIAFAYKITKSQKNFENDLIFLGLTGMEDPPREEVKQSITECHKAGIKVKMITGDNKETALSVAKSVGLNGKILEGKDLDKLTEDELAKIIDTITIFSRVKPEHKMKIINALKANGEIVTMTGDGVNDTPALKVAHVGIAMGKKGTDVSRSVADLTLKDDNFSTIVAAISEGRTIFKNIRKFATYQLSCNIAELGILFFGVLLTPLFGWQIPLLLALQILFMNLVTTDLPAIGLGLNPSSNDAMSYAPRKNSNILNKSLLKILALTSVIKIVLVLSSYFFTFNILKETHEYARTVALVTLIGLEIVSAFNFRSFRKGIFNKGVMVNRYLFWASVISLFLTMLIIYTPLNIIFETIPLSWEGLTIAVTLSLMLGILFDLLKYFNNKYGFIDLEHV